MRPHKSDTLSWLPCAGTLLLLCAASCDGGCVPDEPPLQRVDEVEITKHGVAKRRIGQLKNGKKHGWWLELWDGDRRELQHFKDGVPHGPDRLWFIDDGTPSSDGFYLNGKLHGRTRLFGGDHNNSITRLAWWWHNKPDLFRCEWSDDGRLERIVEYERGHLLEITENPTIPCPYLAHEEGQHHLDPEDNHYLAPGVAGRNTLMPPLMDPSELSDPPPPPTPE